MLPCLNGPEFVKDMVENNPPLVIRALTAMLDFRIGERIDSRGVVMLRGGVR